MSASTEASSQIHEAKAQEESSIKPHMAASNVVNVHAPHRPSYFVAIALRMFLTQTTVQVQGVGSAVQLAIEVSQAILATGFGEVQKVETSSISLRGGAPKPSFRMDIRRIKMPIAPAPLSAQERRFVEAVEKDRPVPIHPDEAAEEVAARRERDGDE